MAYIEALEKLNQFLADTYIGANNASVALGGFELNLKSVVEVGGRVNQSLVALNRVTGMYGKTVNEMAAQTAALSKQFYVPFEKLLSIQQKLAADLPIAITRQRELVSVLQFAAERFGNTEQGIEAYVGALQSLSSKSALAYQDQLLLISAAEKLRKAQQEGGAAVDAASAAYQRQAAISRDNARIMYITGEISRDEYASIRRTTEAMDDQTKARTRTMEATSRAANEFRSAQADLLASISGSEQFNELYEGLQVIPGMIAANLTTKIKEAGLEFFDIDEINVQSEEVQDILKEFGQHAQAAMKEAASEGKTYEEAIAEIGAEIKAQGPVADGLFQAFLQQDGAVKLLKSSFESVNKAQNDEVTLANYMNQLLKDGNVEEYRKLQIKIASAAASKAMMETDDAMALALNRSVAQAKNYNDLMRATVALTEMQLQNLSSIRDLGESIGDTSSLQAERSQEILAAGTEEFKLLNMAASIRRDMAASAKAVLEASGPEKREAALKQVLKAEESVVTAQQAAAEVAGTAAGARAAAEAESVAQNAKRLRSLFEAGQYDEQASFAAKQAADGKNAELAAQQALKTTYDKTLEIATLMGERAEKFANTRVSLARSELELMDSVASGIGASASARAAAAEEQGKVVKALEEQIAGAQADKRLKEELLELDKQSLAQAQAKGDQEAINAAQTKIGNTAAAIQAAEQKIVDTTAKRNNALKTQLELTKQIREGYLDALSAMSEGAGVFSEIIVDQSKNLGTLLRTAKDMPTSLRTGSNTGSGAGISQFTAGGLDAAEWGKDMAEYTNDLVSDQIPEIIEHLSNMANRPTGDMASLNPNRLGAMAEGDGTGRGNLGAGSKPAPAGTTPSTPPSAPSAPAPAGSPSPSANVSPEQMAANAQNSASARSWGASLDKLVAAHEAERAKLVSELSRFSLATGDEISKLIANLNESLGATKESGDKQAMLGALESQISALTSQLAASEAAAKQAGANTPQGAAPSNPSQPVGENRAVSEASGEEKRLAALDQILKAEESVATAQRAAAEAAGTEMGERLAKEAELLEATAKRVRSLFDAGKYDEQAAVSASDQSQKVIASSGESAGAAGAPSPISREDAVGFSSSIVRSIADQAVMFSQMVERVTKIASASSEDGSRGLSVLPNPLPISSEITELQLGLMNARLEDVRSILASLAPVISSGLASGRQEFSVNVPPVSIDTEAISPLRGTIEDGNSRLSAVMMAQYAALEGLTGVAKADFDNLLKGEQALADAKAVSASIASAASRSEASARLDALAAQMKLSRDLLEATKSALRDAVDSTPTVKPQAAEEAAPPELQNLNLDLLKTSVVDAGGLVSSRIRAGISELASILVQNRMNLDSSLREGKSGVVGVLQQLVDIGRHQELALMQIAVRMGLQTYDAASAESDRRAINDIRAEISTGNAEAKAGFGLVGGAVGQLIAATFAAIPTNQPGFDETSRMQPVVVAEPSSPVDMSPIADALENIPPFPTSTFDSLSKSIEALSSQASVQGLNQSPAVRENLDRMERSLDLIAAGVSSPLEPQIIVDVESPAPAAAEVDLSSLASAFPSEIFEYIGVTLSTLATSYMSNVNRQVVVDLEAPESPVVNLDMSSVAEAVRSVPVIPLDMMERMARALELISSESAAATTPSVIVDVQAPKAPDVNVDTSGVADVVRAMPKMPLGLLEEMSKTFAGMSTMLSDTAPAAVTVDVSAPPPPDVTVDISSLVRVFESMPSIPVDLIERMGKAMDSLGAAIGTSEPTSVSVDVEAPEMPAITMDMSGVLSAIQSIPQMPLDLFEGIKKSLDMMSLASGERPTNEVSVSVEPAEPPTISIDTSGIENLIQSIPSIPIDLFEKMMRSLEAIASVPAAAPAQRLEVDVKSPEMPDVIVDVSKVAESVRSIPAVPLDTMERMAKALEYLSSISREAVVPAVVVDVNAPEMPDITIDTSAVVTAVQDMPVLPLSLMEGIARSIESLSSREASSVVPDISVEVPEIKVPPVEVDSAGIEEAIRSIPSFPAEFVDRIYQGIGTLASLLSSRLQPSVTVDMVAPEASATPFDMSPIIGAIQGIPQLPAGTLESIGRSIESIASSQGERVSPEIFVDVQAPQIDASSFDLSPIADVIGAMPKTPTDLFERMVSSVEALISEVSLPTEKELISPAPETGLSTPDINLSPVVDAIVEASVRSDVKFTGMIEALSAASARPPVVPEANVDVEVGAPDVVIPPFDFSEMSAVIGGMPKLPVDSIEAIRSSVSNLLSLSYAQSSRQSSEVVAAGEVRARTEPSPVTAPAAASIDMTPIAGDFYESIMESASMIAANVTLSSSRVEGMLSLLRDQLSLQSDAPPPMVQVSVDQGQVAGVTGGEASMNKVSTNLSELNSISAKSSDSLATIISQVSSISSALFEMGSRQSKYPESSSGEEVSSEIFGDLVSVQRGLLESIGDSISEMGVGASNAVSDSASRVGGIVESAVSSISEALAQIQSISVTSEPAGAEAALYGEINLDSISGAIRDMQSGLVSGINSLKELASSSPAGTTIEMATSFGAALEPKVSELVGGMVDSASVMRDALESGIAGASEVVSGALSESIAGFQSAVESLASSMGVIEVAAPVANAQTSAEASRMELDPFVQAVGDAVGDSLLSMGDQIGRLGESMMNSFELMGAGKALQVEVPTPEISFMELPSPDFSPIISALEGYAKSGMESASYLVDAVKEGMAQVVAGMPERETPTAVTVSPVVNVESPASEPLSPSPGESPRRFSYPELLLASEEGFAKSIEALGMLYQAYSATNTLLSEIGASSAESGKTMGTVDTGTSGTTSETRVDFSDISEEIRLLADVSSTGLSSLQTQVASLVSIIGDIRDIKPAAEAEEPKPYSPSIDFAPVIASDQKLTTSIIDVIRAAEKSVVSSLNPSQYLELQPIEGKQSAASVEPSKNAPEVSGASSPAGKLAAQAIDAANGMLKFMNLPTIPDDFVSGMQGLFSDVAKTNSEQKGALANARPKSNSEMAAELESAAKDARKRSYENSETRLHDELNNQANALEGKAKKYKEMSESGMSAGKNAILVDESPQLARWVASVEKSLEKARTKAAEATGTQDERSANNTVRNLEALLSDAKNRYESAVAKSNESESSNSGAPQSDRLQKEIDRNIDTARASRKSTESSSGASAGGDKTQVADKANFGYSESLNILREDFLKHAERLDAYAREMRDSFSRQLATPRQNENMGARRESASPALPATEPSRNNEDRAASKPALFRDNIGITMPEGFVRSLSTQVAEMTKSQVVPAIVDGFAQAIRQGFSA